MVAIFNGYVEIERWLSELHEDYAESSDFALFSTILNAAVRARMIPANPCNGVRVSKGEFDTERLVATPAQALRAAMRLYELGLGMSGFVLCLRDFYTGARWGELVGQQRHEYDSERRGIEIRTPLKEVGGKVYKGGRKSDDHHLDGRQRPPTRRGNSRPKNGRTKTPAGTRFAAPPPGIAVLCEELMDSHREPFVLCTPEGIRSGGRTSGFGSGGRRGTASSWTTLGRGSGGRRSCRRSRSTRGGTRTATWLTEDGIRRLRGGRGWGRR
ncbi:hypothetical protein AB0F52_44215 [Amycolatopsis sp. NPDC024027]|uniref:hypothetical protein n=1 Tax=Amycolatopsis sp. NPDC024027 TaxID=3154327 RepID=UPI0033ED2450